MISSCDSIKAIIFDLGKVLIDFNHRIAAEKISRFTDKRAEEIFNLFFDSPLTAGFEEGKISPLDFFSEVKKMLNLNLSFQKFVPIWNEIFFLTQENTKVYELAGKLKNYYNLTLLSNVNILHWEYLKNNFSVFDVFHNLIASCEVGVKKPDAAIYKKALDLMKVQAVETFYTDDREELVESAGVLGIKAYVFKGVKQLKQDMKSAGINLSKE